MPDLTAFIGDSYRRLSEINVAAFSLGVSGGLLLGLVPIPLPGGTTFKLGMAGGPLLVGLVLGALRRTGPITWQLSYNASLTLRQLGVVLFLAGVGTRSGYAFVDTLRHGDGLVLLGVGAAVTASAALMILAVGHRVLRVPLPILTGIIAGLQTQPAVLAFAAERSGTDLPNTGYATVYPVATVAKIILAQLLLLFAG
jgi:putative transport protein